LQGSAYTTNDIDIVYARDRDNVRRLIAAIGPLQPQLRLPHQDEELPFILDERTILNGGNFTLSTRLGAVDLLATISGIGGYRSVVALADQLSLFQGKRTTAVLSLEGLIQAKRAAGRVKDKLVLPELESMLEIKRLTDDQPDDSTREE